MDCIPHAFGMAEKVTWLITGGQYRHLTIPSNFLELVRVSRYIQFPVTECCNEHLGDRSEGASLRFMVSVDQCASHEDQ